MNYAPPVGPTCRHIPGSEFAAVSAVRGNRKHLGIDFQPPTPGQAGVPVYAVSDGTVEILFTEIPPGDTSNPFFEGHTGNLVGIRESNRYVWTYQHGTNFKVKHGQFVKAGTHLFDMWISGNVSGVHLHLGLRDQGVFVDPAPRLRELNIWPIGYEKEEITMAQFDEIMRELAAIRNELAGKASRAETRQIMERVNLTATATQLRSHHSRDGQYQAANDEKLNQIARGVSVSWDAAAISAAVESAVSRALVEGVELDAAVTITGATND